MSVEFTLMVLGSHAIESSIEKDAEEVEKIVSR